ncbi:MAG: rhomboid family intramembrane serine protease [Lachnospiraceae bacterium]|nr:rhomboid family intramembrane serine protease [Lachnospiraceae bacterium]
MIATETLILTNIIMWLLVITHKQSTRDLGNCYLLTIERKEYARLITAAFTHEHPLHIFMNMYSLWNIGTFLTGFIGNVNIIVVYLLTAFFGHILACYVRKWQGKGNVLSIGASGSICGLIGVYIILGLKLSAGSGGSFVLSALFPILIMSFSKRIDTVSHLTCLAVGAIMGYIFI